MKIKLLFILTLVPLAVMAQIGRKSLFNEERTMDRRFTLYQGQFRTTGLYDLDIFKSEYDANGDKTHLSDRGISQNQHAFLIRLRYGIIDYLDVQVDFKFRKMNYRGEPYYIIAPPNNSIQLYTDISTKGFEDVYMGLNARAPIPGKKIDLGGSLGIFLPSAKSQSEQPEHSFSSDELGDVINYYNLENWGFGVMSLYYKGFFKFRLSNLAFSGFMESRMPMGESEGLNWTSRLNDNGSFDYQSSTYQHQVPQTVHISGLIEYQLFQWINIHLGLNHYSTRNGWTEENGYKEALLDQRQIWINPGYEILVSNKLWLRQGVYFPISGENMYSQFRIQTTFYYNVFMN